MTDIKQCGNCGGTHYGSRECPFNKESCIICGTPTVYACSDCAIDGKPGVHVCENPTCRDRHEAAAKHETV